MNVQHDADVLDGPEPPVPELSNLDPTEEVPAALDRAVRIDIRRRLRAERPRRGRTATIAGISAVAAAAAAVCITLWMQPRFGRDDGMVAKGAGGDVEVFLDYLVQRDGESVPHRLDRGDVLRTGDGVYLRAEISEPGALTFLVEEPGDAWAPLATLDGAAGANDLQRDGRLKVFYVTEAGPYRFAAVWSDEHPPSDWEPGAAELPDATQLGQGAEVAWIEIEAHPAGR